MRSPEIHGRVVHWTVGSVFCLPNLMCLLAYGVGLMEPESASRTASLMSRDPGPGWALATAVRLHPATFLYVLALLAIGPASLYWIHRKAVGLRVHGALRRIAVANLATGLWNPHACSLRRGLFRLGLYITFFVLLLAVEIAGLFRTLDCVDCAERSFSSFFLMHWFAFQALVVVTYIVCSYMRMWGSIHRKLAAGRIPKMP